MGVWSTPRPGRFIPGKETRYPLYRRLGGPQGLSVCVQKISPLPRFDPRTLQPVASRYTDNAIPLHNKLLLWLNLNIMRYRNQPEIGLNLTYQIRDKEQN